MGDAAAEGPFLALTSVGRRAFSNEWGGADRPAMIERNLAPHSVRARPLGLRSRGLSRVSAMVESAPNGAFSKVFLNRRIIASRIGAHRSIDTPRFGHVPCEELT